MGKKRNGVSIEEYDTGGDFGTLLLYKKTNDIIEKQFSQQLPPALFDEAAKRGAIIRPPYDPRIWALLLEQSTRLKRLTDAMAINTVGLGWELVPKKEGDEFATENRDEIETERARIAPLFETPNFNDPFPELSKKIKIDEEATGNGYYENSRNNSDEPDGIWHVPAHTIRVTFDGELFVQIRKPVRPKSKGGRSDFSTTVDIINRANPSDDKPQVIFFKKFGDTRIIDKRDGLPKTRLGMRNRANELIQMSLYTPRSSFYGIPRAVSAAPAIAGSRLAALRNVSFFENDAPVSVDSAILTPHGWSTMGKMQIGSEVIGSDGKPHKVVGVYPQGELDLYSVEFSDGHTAECSLNHVWCVSNSYDRKREVTRTLSLQELLDGGFRYASGTAKWAIPMPDPVEYASGEVLPVDPYLVGLLLGNGSMACKRVSLSCNHKDTVELEGALDTMLPDDMFVGRRDRGNWSEFSFKPRAHNSRTNTLRDGLINIGLMGCRARTKFIPEMYLRASIEDRIAVLQGLIDTDGHIGKTAVRYTTVSERLARSIVDLVGGLGGVASMKPTTNRDIWQLTICRLPDHITPARLSRKVSAYSPPQTSRIRSIVGAKFSRKAEAQCIRVDVRDSLYIMENHILTHNTPRMAVIVEGGKLSAESVEMIKNFITTEGKGVKNAHRVMVLQAAPQDPLVPGATPTKITLVPLTVGGTDDASFSNYRAVNDEEIREAFGIGKVFIGTSDDVNRAVAIAMKQLTLEQVFEPEILRYEHRINNTYMRALDAEFTRFRFKRPKTTDLTQDSQALATLAAAGGITPNDIRDFLEKSQFQSEWADTPISALKLGLIESTEEGINTLEDAGIILPNTGQDTGEAALDKAFDDPEVMKKFVAELERTSGGKVKIVGGAGEEPS